MARSGIYKSDVKKARHTLMAQGKNPSIDAIRAELGNTGSKTTIHRYLKELEEDEGAGFGLDVTVSEAIQHLVGRLADQLHEEANVRIGELQLSHTEQVAQHNKIVSSQQQEIEALKLQAHNLQSRLQDEQNEHHVLQQTYQVASLHNAQLTQQVIDLKERLQESEAYRQSLEDKHLHARQALEHYRDSAKEQREQEQRRHEMQVQQLQTEQRTLNQTLIVKQNELVRSYQEAARSGTELLATRKELHRSEQEAEKSEKIRNEQQECLVQLEASVATLNERLQQASKSRDDLWRHLMEITRQVSSVSIHSQESSEEKDDKTIDLFASAQENVSDPKNNET